VAKATSVLKRLFTYEEASTYSGISIRRLRERVRENRIPFKREGTLILLELSDLDAYIDTLPNEQVAR
jgi:excisionase family DNA binding protein